MTKPRKSLITRGFRPREDQIARLEGPGGIFAKNPELNWSNVSRMGIDLFITQCDKEEVKKT